MEIVFAYSESQYFKNNEIAKIACFWFVINKDVLYGAFCTLFVIITTTNTTKLNIIIFHI